MRDPRESRWAFFDAIVGGLASWQISELSYLTDMAVVRSREDVRILSMTRDQERSSDQIFGRGFARPRLWEQYAGNHVGVCLGLDRDALAAAVATSVAQTGQPLWQGAVAYRDGPIASDANRFDLADAGERAASAGEEGVDSAVAEHIARHRDELLFTKLTDWASESEYRFVTRWSSNDELFVDLEGSLKAILVGHEVSQSYAPSLYGLCEPRGVGVAKVDWLNGRPDVSKMSREVTGF